MKRETKDNIKQAVSNIRNCFSLMKMTLVREIKQHKTHGAEMEMHAGDKGNGGDSRPTEQLATSFGELQEPEENGERHSMQVPPPNGDERKSNAHLDGPVGVQSPAPKEGTKNGSSVENHRGKDNSQHTEAPLNPNPMQQPDTDMEVRIMQKVNQQIQGMMRNISKMIRKEIENGASTDIAHNSNANPPTQRNAGIEVDEDNTHNTENDNTGYNQEEQDNWAEVRRRRKANTHIIGTGESKETLLRAADQKAWLYIGRLHQTTEREDLINHMRMNNIMGTIECEELEVRGTNKAFRVGIQFDMKQQAGQPRLWPKGVVVRQYIFRRQQNQGIRIR